MDGWMDRYGWVDEYGWIDIWMDMDDGYGRMDEYDGHGWMD